MQLHLLVWSPCMQYCAAIVQCPHTHLRANHNTSQIELSHRGGRLTSQPFLFLDDFEGNPKISIAIISGSTVWLSICLCESQGHTQWFNCSPTIPKSYPLSNVSAAFAQLHADRILIQQDKYTGKQQFLPSSGVIVPFGNILWPLTCIFLRRF